MINLGVIGRRFSINLAVATLVNVYKSEPEFETDRQNSGIILNSYNTLYCFSIIELGYLFHSLSKVFWN